MKTKRQAIKFFAKYFECTEKEAESCHHMTIDCMVKFANSTEKRKRRAE